MAGVHHVAVLLQAWGSKGLCCELESHQGATPEQGAADLGSNKNTEREGGAQCHILGQSLPVSTMSSAAEEVSLVKVKAGEFRTLVQACLIVGRETSKLETAFPRFQCQRQTASPPSPTASYWNGPKRGPSTLHLCICSLCSGTPGLCCAWFLCS